MFVLIMYKIAMGSKRANFKNAYTFDEAYAEIPLDSISGKETFALKHPEGGLHIPGQRVAGGKLLIEIPNHGLLPGCYEIVSKSSGQVAGALALNHAKKESDLTTYSAADLKAAFEGRPNIRVFDQSDEEHFASALQNKQPSTWLWRLFLLLALLCLLAETLTLRFWKS
jgi:hypothetical protein